MPSRGGCKPSPCVDTCYAKGKAVPNVTLHEEKFIAARAHPFQARCTCSGGRRPPVIRFPRVCALSIRISATCVYG